MKKIVQAIIVMMTAMVLMGGCEFIDKGKKKIMPYGTVTPAAGSDASLKSLGVEYFAISPSFEADTTDYSIVVKKSETTAITVKAIGPDGAAVTAAINGGAAVPVSETDYSAAVTLDEALDTNTIVVAVTSEDGATMKEYTLRIYYYGTSASLSGLTVALTSGSPGSITSELSPAFDAGTSAYTVGISYAVTSIDITIALPEGSGMTALVDGWTAVSGLAVPITDLPSSGTTRTITVAVTSQDRLTTNNYTVTVVKDGEPSHEARLDYLQLKGYSAAWYIVDVGATAAMLQSTYMYAVKDSNAYWRSKYRVYISPLDDSVSSMTAKVYTNNQDPDTAAAPLNSGSFVADGSYWIYTFDKAVFNTSMYPLDIHIHIIPEDQDSANEMVYQLRINK